MEQSPIAIGKNTGAEVVVMTDWAECDLCGSPTDPSANVAGVPDPGDVVVWGQVGNEKSRIGSVEKRERRKDYTTS